MNNLPFLRKLGQREIWRRLICERLNEPLHLQLTAACVAAFGSFRSRVYWDCIIRQHNAYGILRACDRARECGQNAVTVVEFGVGPGAGLLNMQAIAMEAERATGVTVFVDGFDTGNGMPKPEGWRDHPDLYGSGDFALPNRAALEARCIPGMTCLHVGYIAKTVDEWDPIAPIGYIVLDVDYWSSAKDSLRVFTKPATKFQPVIDLYLDDCDLERHSQFAGEQLAIRDWNDIREPVKIERNIFLRCNRPMQRARWLSKMWTVHQFKHPLRTEPRMMPAVLQNPYL